MERDHRSSPPVPTLPVPYDSVCYSLSPRPGKICRRPPQHQARKSAISSPHLVVKETVEQIGTAWARGRGCRCPHSILIRASPPLPEYRHPGCTATSYALFRDCGSNNTRRCALFAASRIEGASTITFTDNPAENPSPSTDLPPLHYHLLLLAEGQRICRLTWLD